eukprot:Rhum_TRINITY_DN14226_c18_g1::Rhum_TRINITY_DN14226_c18_g1_i1::g.75976::m.75976
MAGRAQRVPLLRRTFRPLLAGCARGGEAGRRNGVGVPVRRRVDQLAQDRRQLQHLAAAVPLVLHEEKDTAQGLADLLVAASRRQAQRRVLLDVCKQQALPPLDVQAALVAAAHRGSGRTGAPPNAAVVPLLQVQHARKRQQRLLHSVPKRAAHGPVLRCAGRAVALGLPLPCAVAERVRGRRRAGRTRRRCSGGGGSGGGRPLDVGVVLQGKQDVFFGDDLRDLLRASVVADTEGGEEVELTLVVPDSRDACRPTFVDELLQRNPHCLGLSRLCCGFGYSVERAGPTRHVKQRAVLVVEAAVIGAPHAVLPLRAAPNGTAVRVHVAAAELLLQKLDLQRVAVVLAAAVDTAAAATASAATPLASACNAAVGSNGVAALPR